MVSMLRTRDREAKMCISHRHVGMCAFETALNIIFLQFFWLRVATIRRARHLSPNAEAEWKHMEHGRKPMMLM